jgi:hypothetical protein
MVLMLLAKPTRVSLKVSDTHCSDTRLVAAAVAAVATIAAARAAAVGGQRRQGCITPRHQDMSGLTTSHCIPCTPDWPICKASCPSLQNPFHAATQPSGFCTLFEPQEGSPTDQSIAKAQQSQQPPTQHSTACRCQAGLQRTCRATDTSTWPVMAEMTAGGCSAWLSLFNLQNTACTCVLCSG